jgi:hypothetical protein
VHALGRALRRHSERVRMERVMHQAEYRANIRARMARYAGPRCVGCGSAAATTALAGVRLCEDCCASFGGRAA